MGPIVCATRGGEASRRTQERAIALALEWEAPLIFIFVVDSNLDRPIDEELNAIVADELERLGKRLLCIAQVRAQEQGVSADIVVRHGTVRQVIEDFLLEVHASTLILGMPQNNSHTQAFAQETIPQFAQELRAATGVEVIIVE